MKTILLMISVLLSLNSFAGINPTTLKIKVYQFAVSTSKDCSNPITLFSSTSPQQIDMLVGPQVGAGKLPKGTYNCVMIRMSDLITFKPATSNGNCTAGQDYTIDVCSATAGSSTTPLSTDGTFSADFACAGTADSNTGWSEDIVTLYLTTGSSNDPATGSVSGDTFLKPASGATTTSRGIKLHNAWEITAFGAGKFSVNGTGKITSGGGGNCTMAPPIFSFANNI